MVFEKIDGGFHGLTSLGKKNGVEFRGRRFGFFFGGGGGLGVRKASVFRFVFLFVMLRNSVIQRYADPEKRFTEHPRTERAGLRGRWAARTGNSKNQILGC